MLGSLVCAIVLQESDVPAIGSNALATEELPPADVNVFAASEPKVTPGRCSASHVRALYGPPSGVVLGQVWLNAVTDPGAGPFAEFARWAEKNREPWLFRYLLVSALFAPRLWPRSPNWRLTGNPEYAVRR